MSTALFSTIVIPQFVLYSFYSGTQPITPTVTTVVSTRAFAAALKEYENDLVTETDGEDGGNQMMSR